jgi:hypothetical protein
MDNSQKVKGFFPQGMLRIAGGEPLEAFKIKEMT